MQRGTRVLVLGPCVVESTDDGPGTVGAEGSASPRATRIDLSLVQRKVLSRLAIARPGTVGFGELVEAVWGDAPPATAKTSMHNQISRIRRRIGPDSIHTSDGRYGLTVGTDAELATEVLAAAEALAAGGAHLDAHHRAADGLALWRGTPLDELGDLEDVRDLRRRLEELQRSLETVRLSTAVAAGLLGWAVPEAERLVAATPHDEHRWSLLVAALDASGRRGDALGAFDRARRAIATDLGLEPGEELLAAEAAVLRSGRSRRREAEGDLVGRADLVAKVVDAALAGRSVLLIGEPGIGRTRVLDAVGREVGRAGGTAGRSAFALHPGSATSTLVDLVDDLGAELDPTLPPVAAVEAAVRAAAVERSPLVLCLDDVDRAGPTSLQALRAAAAVDGVAVVATAVDVDGGIDGFEVLTVPPLDADEVAELVTAITGEALDAPGLRWLASMAGGNPMIVEHLVDDLDGADLAATAGSRDVGWSTSSELRELIRHRLVGVDGATKSALEVASVLGPRFPAELLDALAPADGIAGALVESLLVEPAQGGAPARDRDGTVRGRELAFRHGAVREILYDDLATGRRIELHHAAAEVLAAAGAPATRTAVHAVAAADADPVSATGWALAAAADASTVGAHAEAATWYERAAGIAEATPDGPRLRVQALVGRGDELRQAGSTEQEAALFTAADAAFELGDADLIGDAAFALLQLGATTESGSLHEQAIEVADRALGLVTDPDRRALIAGAASLTHSMTGAARRCRKLFLEAEALATRSETRRAVLPFAFLALGHPQDLAHRERVTSELLALGELADDPIALFEAHQLAFSVALQRADGPRVRSSLAALEQVFVRVGDVGRRWALLYHRAALQHLDGDLDASEATSEAALEVFAPVSPSRAFATHGGQLLALRLAQGRLPELTDVLEALVTDQPGVPAWNSALALAIAEADPPRAVHHALAALDDVGEDFTWLAAHLIGGRAAAATGDPDACARYLERLTPWTGLVCWQGTCSYGPVDTVLALLLAAVGRDDEAERHRDVALARAQRLAAPVFERELHELRHEGRRSS